MGYHTICVIRSRTGRKCRKFANPPKYWRSFSVESTLFYITMYVKCVFQLLCYVYSSISYACMVLKSSTPVLIFLPNYARCCTAVSYTHLDVYKRQHTHTHTLISSFLYTEVVQVSSFLVYKNVGDIVESEWMWKTRSSVCENVKKSFDVLTFI